MPLSAILSPTMTVSKGEELSLKLIKTLYKAIEGAQPCKWE